MGVRSGWAARIRIGLDTVNNNSVWCAAIDPRISNFEINSDYDMEKIYVLGTKTKVDTIEGTQDLTGSMERYLFADNASNQIIYVNAANNTDLRYVSGLYGNDLVKCKVLANMTDPNATAADKFGIVIRGVKFYGYSINPSVGDTTKENVDWEGENLSTL